MSSQTVLNETEPTGARWLREEFSWAEIEPQNDSWQWNRYDHLMIEAADRNMRVLPVLFDTPSWAGSAWNDIPSNPSEFAQYAAKVTERYGPGWNLLAGAPRYRVLRARLLRDLERALPEVLLRRRRPSGSLRQAGRGNRHCRQGGESEGEVPTRR